MATAKPKSTANPPPPRRRSLLRTAAIVGVALLALLAWFWKPLRGYAVTGASYGAHVACSCRYIGGRSLGDCRKDFERGMGLIMLSEDRKEMSVTATFPLLSRQTATFRNGQGCVLENWDD